MYEIVIDDMSGSPFYKTMISWSDGYCKTFVQDQYTRVPELKSYVESYVTNLLCQPNLDDIRKVSEELISCMRLGNYPKSAGVYPRTLLELIYLDINNRDVDFLPVFDAVTDAVYANNDFKSMYRCRTFYAEYIKIKVTIKKGSLEAGLNLDV